MYKTSAQQIRRLELRIAKLEKEAGILSDIGSVLSGVGNKLINIPKNFLNNMLSAFSDAGSQIANEFLTPIKGAHETVLAVALSTRVASALSSGAIDTSDIPYLVANGFNVKNPIKSLFTGGEAGSSKIPLDKLANLYDGEDQKRIKKAYLSWKSDYSEHLIDLQGIKREDKNIIIKFFKGLLKMLQRTSKLLYRLLKAYLTFFSAVELAVAPWSMIFLMTACSMLSLANLLNYNAVAMAPAPNGMMQMFLKNPPPDAVNFNSLKAFGIGRINLGGFWTTFTRTAISLLEKAFYRYGVNVDAFDAESQGRTASRYPRIASVTRQLEAYAY